MLKRSIATSLLSLCSRCLQPSKSAGQTWQHVRGSVTAAAHVQTPDSRVIVVTLPMLSPSMTQGSLSGWAKNQGDVVEPYDLVYELETETLTEEAYRVGDFAGEWTSRSSTQACLPYLCIYIFTIAAAGIHSLCIAYSVWGMSDVPAVHDWPVLHRTHSHGNRVSGRCISCKAIAASE